MYCKYSKHSFVKCVPQFYKLTLKCLHFFNVYRSAHWMKVALIFISERPKTPPCCLFLQQRMLEEYLRDIIMITTKFQIRLSLFFQCKSKHNYHCQSFPLPIHTSHFKSISRGQLGCCSQRLMNSLMVYPLTAEIGAKQDVLLLYHRPVPVFPPVYESQFLFCHFVLCCSLLTSDL